MGRNNYLVIESKNADILQVSKHSAPIIANSKYAHTTYEELSIYVRKVRLLAHVNNQLPTFWPECVIEHLYGT